MKKKIMKAVSVLLSVLLVAGLVDNSAFATAAMEENEGIKRIVRFLNAPEDMNVPPGTGEKNLALPETLFALVTDEAGEEGIIPISDVAWHSDDYEPYTIGIYEFTALFILPDNVMMIEEMGEVMLRIGIVEEVIDDEVDEENVTADEPVNTLADEENTEETTDEKKRTPIKITSFAKIGRIKVDQGAVLGEDWLPGDVPAYTGLRNRPGDMHYVAVESWAVRGQAFDTQVLGLYEFVPVLAKYEGLAEDISLPVLEVEVVAATLKTMAAITFAGGSGTASDPYQIATAAQLADLAREVNAVNVDYRDKYYILNNDIDLSAYSSGKGWTPIGDDKGYIFIEGRYTPAEFIGHFDGNGKTISNLVINSDDWILGLFGSIREGSVRNLAVAGAKITGNGESTVIGVISGQGLIDRGEGTRFVNCYATDIDIKVTTGNYITAGGLVGYVSGSNIESSYSTGTITSDSSGGYVESIGGIAGGFQYGSLSKSFSTCDISGSNMYVSNAGGIVGELGHEAEISDCYSTGNIRSSSSEWGGAGGIAGVMTGYDGSYGNYEPSLIGNSYAIGEVTGTRQSYAGGVAGFIYGNAKNSAALNPRVSGEAGGGRVVGGTRPNASLENNHALRLCS